MLTTLGVLLGETLYLDGGDISVLDSTGVCQAIPLNSTYSIDVSTSWTPREAVLNTIDKGDSPILNRPNLWPAPDAKGFLLLQRRSEPGRPILP
jgi:hypothetical protein